MKEKTLAVGAAVAALFFLGKGSFTPVQVPAGKLVSVQTYRIITNRRQGMTYISAQPIENNNVTFTSEVDALFTRNVVQDGGGLWAELKI